MYLAINSNERVDYMDLENTLVYIQVRKFKRGPYILQLDKV